jgi:hypothetical protein
MMGARNGCGKGTAHSLGPSLVRATGMAMFSRLFYKKKLLPWLSREERVRAVRATPRHFQNLTSARFPFLELERDSVHGLDPVAHVLGLAIASTTAPGFRVSHDACMQAQA